MSDSSPPSEKTKRVDWAALGSALAALVIGLGAYVKAKTEPQAQGAYETLATQVIKMQESIDKNHEDLEKLSGYVASSQKEQGDKLRAVADAMDSAVVPVPSPPSPAASEAHVEAKKAVKKARAQVTVASPPPPVISPPLARADRAKLDASFKEGTRIHE